MQPMYRNTLFGLLAAIGLALFIMSTASDLRYAPEPEIDQETASTIARHFLSNDTNITNLSDYRTSVLYTNDALAHSFLRQQLGEHNASRYLQSQGLPQLEFEVRFYQPSQQEEATVKVSAETGNVTELSYILPEDRSRPSLQRATAENYSSQILRKRGFVAEQLQLKDYAKTAHRNRTDHRFTYRVPNTTIHASFGTASQLIEVGIHGNRLGAYDYYLKTPEDFSRYVGGQRGSGMFIAGLSLLASVAMLILAAIAAVKAFRKTRPHWRPWAVFALALTALIFVNRLNTLPLLLHDYNTAMAIPIFLGIRILPALIVAGAFGATVFVSATAGSAMASHYWSNRIKALREATRGYTKHLLASVGRGYALAFILLGVTTLLYAAGSELFNVWQFASVNQLNLLNAVVPAFTIFVTISLFPAFSEELLYRLFGITFFTEATRSKAAAIGITAIIWAVAHATHPVFPFYFRAIEVTVIGLVLGTAFVMFDITTTITAHFVFNAITALPLFLIASGPLTISTAFVVILFPLIASVGWRFYSQRGMPQKR